MSGIALPPGLYERHSGSFYSCFFLEPDGSFRLRWHDSVAGTALQGAGQAIEILEQFEGRVLKYELRLRGDFACAVPQVSDASTARAIGEADLPKGFGEAGAKKAKVRKSKKGGKAKATVGAKKKKKQPARPAANKATPPTAVAGASAAAAPSTDGAEGASSAALSSASARMMVVEVLDGPYVMHESIACPAAAGATADEMRAWIAHVAASEVANAEGAQLIEELRAPGFPFNLFPDEEEEEEDDDEGEQPERAIPSGVV